MTDSGQLAGTVAVEGEDKKNSSWQKTVFICAGTTAFMIVLILGMMWAFFNKPFIPRFWWFVILASLTPTIYRAIETNEWLMKKIGKPVPSIFQTLMVWMFIFLAIGSFFRDEKLMTRICQPLVSSASSQVSKEKDFKIYKPGTYIFSLKAGEKTDHWIKLSPEVTSYDISSQDDKFQLIFDDGKVVPAWTPGKWPDNKYRFKILAVTDQLKVNMILEGSEKAGVALKQQ